jgi:hypothetical protein
MREGAKSPSRARMEDQISFQHTQLGVYLAGAFGLVYLWSSSAQVLLLAAVVVSIVTQAITSMMCNDWQIAGLQRTCNSKSPPATRNLKHSAENLAFATAALA